MPGLAYLAGGGLGVCDGRGRVLLSASTTVFTFMKEEFSMGPIGERGRRG